MTRATWLPILGLAGAMAMASSASGQYIGFVYPAGGQQGTTFHVMVGGQRLDYIDKVLVTGEGMSARVVESYRRMNNQELRFLRDQLRELKQGKSVVAPAMTAMMASAEGPAVIGPAKTPEKTSAKTPKKTPAKTVAKTPKKTPAKTVAKTPKKTPAKTVAKTAEKTSAELARDEAKQKLMDRIQRRLSADQRRPACRSLPEIVFVEVTVAADAKPGAHQIRLVTKRGVSNPMVFQVGQVPEVARKPMKTAAFQVLGKENLAQRKRPPEEEEQRVKVPCTMNGQIASGEANRYRFQARKGQRLVISVKARELIPYIADGVPGWFQPVLTLCDAKGKELAYSDDYRFRPDPTLYYEVLEDGECVLTITDAIYRGREDFVYRITVGEVPFVTSIFPLGGRVGEPVTIEMDGWNLDKAKLTPPPKGAKPGIHRITVKNKGFVSNSMPFALDTLPECFDEESNNDPSHAQKVKLPIIVNGRMDQPDDWDVFQVEGRAGDTIVAEVNARRLESPVDSFLKFTDASGKLLAFNDDHQDVSSGVNTHHADSYLMVKLPADGTYYVHLGETARHGGKEYAYRLRISPPRPDFELRVVPPNINIRGKGSAAVSVYGLRKDGFDGPIKLSFKDLPEGFTSRPVTLAATKDVARLTVKSTLADMKEPISLSVVGSVKIQEGEVVHQAVPAEDRMQAFLWRHLVPAEDLMALVYNASYKPPEPRVRPPTPKKEKPADPNAKAKYTKKQVAGLLRQIERLYQEWLLTDDFTNKKVAEIEVAL